MNFIKKYGYVLVLVILFVFFNDIELFARAGGGGDYSTGGSGSSGSSGSDDGWFLTAVFFVLEIIPYPYNIVIIAILAIIFIGGWISKKLRK